MRAQSELEIRILDLIEPVAKSLELDVVRVRVTGSQTPTLQIMAERPDGTMTVQMCGKFSRAISPVLEAEDPISSEYHLEVSSPGIDRPLTRVGDFAKWLGQEVKVEIGAPVDGRKRYHGHIVAETDGVVELALKDGGSATLAVADMVRAHLVFTDKLVQAARAKGQAPAEIEEDEELADSLGDDFDDVDVADDLEDEDSEDGDLVDDEDFDDTEDELDAEAEGPASAKRK